MNSKNNLILIISLSIALLCFLSSVSASENMDNTVSDNHGLNKATIKINHDDKTLNSNQIKNDDNNLMRQDKKKNNKTLKKHENIKIKQINKTTSDKMGDYNFDVKIPKTAYYYKSDQDESSDSFNIIISISKNANGNLTIYKDKQEYEKININPNIPLESKEDDYFDEYEYYVTSEGDLYNIKVPISPFSIGKNNVTVKFKNNKTLEKSGIVNGKFYMDFEGNWQYGTKKMYIHTTSIYHDYDGKLSVQIDKKKYTVKRDGEMYYIKLASPLSIGKHTMKVTYNGPKYPTHSVQGQLNVFGIIENIGYSNEYGFNTNDGDKISLKLPKNAKGKLVVQFYNSQNKSVQKFSQKLVNGKASISVVNSESYGRYSKVVGKYTGKDYTVQTAVGKDVSIYPPINMPNEIIKGEKKYISIDLPSTKEGILKIVVRPKDENKGTYSNSNALTISKNLVNGKAKISLSKFKVGDVHKVRFDETKNGKKVDKYEYNVHVAILNPLKIISSKLRYGKANIKIKAYKTTTKPLAKKTITIKINNKIVKKVKTNKKGIAIFKMPKKYKPKTYKITAQYKNDSITKKIKIIP